MKTPVPLVKSSGLTKLDNMKVSASITLAESDAIGSVELLITGYGSSEDCAGEAMLDKIHEMERALEGVKIELFTRALKRSLLNNTL
jgi:hypothetical protein